MLRRTICSAGICVLLLVTVSITRGDDQTPPADPRWPANVNVPEGVVTVFQPQLQTYENGNVITSQSAVSINLPNQDEPVFGVIWLRDRVQTDPNAGTVTVIDMTVTACRFPSDVGITAEELTAGLEPVVQQPIILQLSQVQQLATVAQQADTAAADVQTAPPRIVFLTHPAVKVQYDGPPKLEQTPDGLYHVVNTPFFVALDPASRTYYLKGGGYWFSAPDALGPFTLADSIPGSIINLALSSGYTDPQTQIPPEQAQSVQIVTATEPTELVWTDGPPQFQTIQGTGLLYWANTDSDFFVSLDNQQKYLLLSGRWFTAPKQRGPWTYVPADQLPQDFSQIPPGSPKSDVLASIPGTQVAQDAAADAQIPQASAVDTTDYQQPPVEYDGDPQFQDVQGTQCSYAVNTPYQIIRVRGRYYCCYNAVWYQCDNPSGNWGICYQVPQDIYTLPPSCPDYSCRYVYVYGRRGSLVYVGYTSGYTGAYVVHGVVVYGTGYHYQPWAGRQYYARPATYGYAAHYSRHDREYSMGAGGALGGGDAWVPHPKDESRPDPRQRVFGDGGFRQRNAAPRPGRPAPTVVAAPPPTRRPTIYDRRPDVHPEILAQPQAALTGKYQPKPRKQPANPPVPPRQGSTPPPGGKYPPSKPPVPPKPAPTVENPQPPTPPRYNGKTPKPPKIPPVVPANPPTPPTPPNPPKERKTPPVKTPPAPPTPPVVQPGPPKKAPKIPPTPPAPPPVQPEPPRKAPKIPPTPPAPPPVQPEPPRKAPKLPPPPPAPQPPEAPPTSPTPPKAPKTPPTPPAPTPPGQTPPGNPPKNGKKSPKPGQPPPGTPGNQPTN